MKKILILAFLAGSIPTIAQEPITVGKVKALNKTLASLSYTVNPDTVYTLVFRNAKYSTIDDYKTVAYYSGQNDTLYQLLKSASKEPKTIRLGNKEAIIVYSGGAASLNIDGGFILLMDKQIDKLFGK